MAVDRGDQVVLVLVFVAVLGVVCAVAVKAVRLAEHHNGRPPVVHVTRR